MLPLFLSAKQASHSLQLLTDAQRNTVLQAVADAIIVHTDDLLAANATDLARMDKANPMYDRLLLNADRLQGIADDMRHVATLPSPLGRTLKEKTLPNGLHLRRVSVPFGVIGMIYEARPNVTFDVFSLCFKSGNACVLKGGKDAEASCRAGVSLIKEVLRQQGIDPSAIELLPFTHEATGEMLTAVDYIDLCIPRGGKRLIQFVRDNAKVPVIETGAGVVHCYFDQDGDLDMGRRIILNAKTRRPSVCNALDCIIIHASRLADLPALVAPLGEKGVRLHADERAYQALIGRYPSAPSTPSAPSDPFTPSTPSTPSTPYSPSTLMEKITIVKVGGAIVEDDQRLPQLLQAFAAISGPKILVHGGGRSATKIAAALGIESHMVDGRRITDAEMLRVVTMVYGGLVNKQLVARLQALGVNAVGLTGADIDVIRSHKRPLRNGIDYGFVGDVDRVDAPRLAQLLHEGITPVLAPLTHDGMGHLLNTNADTIASETASALAALKTDATAAPATNNPDEIAAFKTEGAGDSLYDVTLVYCFEKPGVLANPDDDTSVIRHINRDEFDHFVADGTISGGMKPKIENALAAVERGVARVIITQPTALDGNHGTIVESSPQPSLKGSE